MKKSITLLLVGILSCSTLWAQKDRAFMGHKNLLDVSYSIYAPLFTSDQNKYYVREDTSLTLKQNSRPRSGLQLSLTRHLFRNTSLGFEFDYATSKYAPNTYGSLSSSYNIESIAVNTMAFIGKFEFGRRQGIFPIGVSHQVGVGCLVVSPKERSGTLLATPKDYYYYNPNKEISYTLESIKGVTILYNLNFRASLSDRILLNFGLRYNVNFFPGVYHTSKNSPVSESGMATYFNTKLGFNLMRFYTGVSFSF